MKVGYSKRVLDVETPTLLAGTHLDRKVHNDTQNLELHSMSFETDTTRIHFVTVDILGIDANIVKDVQYMFPNDHLIIHATHTLHGPGGLWMPNHPKLKDHESLLKPFNAYQTYLLKDNLVQVIQDSISDLSDCESISQSTLPQTPNPLIAFEFKTKDKTQLFIHQRYHPQMIPETDTHLHPGYMETLRNQTTMYDGVVACCGDIKQDINPQLPTLTFEPIQDFEITVDDNIIRLGNIDFITLPHQAKDEDHNYIGWVNDYWI